MKLKFDEFLRSVAISKNNTYSLLLGAGCSISSGIQSAEDCIWDWKKKIYCSNNGSAQNWVNNFKNPRTKDIIQNWLDNQGCYIPRGSFDEYSFYAETCYPVEEHRRQYFQQICANKIPAIGYRIIPLLMEYGIINSVWTTNFDDLISKSCTLANVTPIDITLDSIQRLSRRSQSSSELPIIKLHGDFKYGELKNTNKELQSQDNTFRQKLIEYTRDKHLIILGYSGRDTSLMETLKEAYSQDGGGILYWCGYGNNVPSKVKQLLECANRERKAYYIPTDGFDTTLLNLAKLIMQDNENLKKKLSDLQQNNKQEDWVPFHLNTPRVNKILKSNCFQIEFPEEVFIFDATINDKPWKFVNDRVLKQTDIVAVPFKNQIWALGTLNKIKQVFSDVIQGDIVRRPLGDVKSNHSTTICLLLSAICKIFNTQHNLSTNFKNKIWEKSKSQYICNNKVFDAIRFSLERIQNQYYLTLNPNFALIENDIDLPTRQQIGMQFYHKIWNSPFNDYINYWRKRLFYKQEQYEFPANSGSGFYFKIIKNPIFTEICDFNNSYYNKHNVSSDMLKLKGVQFSEPELLFSTKNGHQHVADIHPIRGLTNNRPYETDLNNLLENSINLGVIAPYDDSQKLYDFLIQQNTQIKNTNIKDQYVTDFEGFHNIYGISLNIPSINSHNWTIVSEPIKHEITKNAHEIKKNICDSIALIEASNSCKIIVIYIPERWEKFTTYNIDGESFDLHDYIKAFCVSKGIMTQFMREKTINEKYLSCQVNWWLSLSYYAKSLRTPWVLAKMNPTTAFAGLGYSIDSKEKDSGHIILGCSHIYSSTGEGLKYKLSRINNDKIHWRHKKPHLCYDDAYEFGRNIINLFYESMNELPKRVVIHKRTFFTEEEKKGILDSLYENKKIESIDLIEINFEDDIRYVSSKTISGATTIDSYPVSRGTCVQINSKEALLWVHGVVPSVKNPKYNFYPGGRYIPKPLRVIKHYGQGSLEEIANEILGLTKMNWNSFNMYSKLPATISSSNDIARIGKLIEHHGKIEYDYRYFI